MLALLGLADNLGLRDAEILALGNLLLDRLALSDLLVHDAEQLGRSAVACKHRGLRSLTSVDPLD